MWFESMPGSQSSIRVQTLLCPFLFCRFPGSSGAKSRTVPREPSASCRSSQAAFSTYCLQRTLLPRRRSLHEQLARPARQAKRIECLVDRRRRCLLNILDLAQQAVLFRAPRGRLLVEELRRDSSVEFMYIHYADAALDLVVAARSLLIVASRAACSVRSELRTASPSQSRIAGGTLARHTRVERYALGVRRSVLCHRHDS